MTLATRVTALAQAIGADIKALYASAGGPPDALTITYTGDRVTGIDEDGVDTTITYNADGTVHTVSYPVGALTRTETYSYTAGVLTGMTAAEA
jgi:uncharacterized lipoprotein NlpE involved in copper resistance